MEKNKRDTSRKRESILRAAIEAFSEQGYDTTSMDAIAERAGASKRTVYNHFPSKEDLFRAVIDRFALEMHSLKQIRYDNTRSLEDQLGDFADAELALAQNPMWMGFIKVLLIMFIRDPKMASESMSRHGSNEDTLKTWLEEAARDGKISVDNSQLAARVFWAMLGGAFTWPSVYQGYLDGKMAREMKKEIIETFLCRYRC